MLNAGEKVVMLVGAGALHARQEVLAAAEALASPIVKALSGKGVVPDDHPHTTGGLGLLGTAPSEDAIESCDTLFMVGTNFPYTKYLPDPGKCKVVQIEAVLTCDSGTIATWAARHFHIRGDRQFFLSATRGDYRHHLVQGQDPPDEELAGDSRRASPEASRGRLRRPGVGAGWPMPRRRPCRPR